MPPRGTRGGLHVIYSYPIGQEIVTSLRQAELRHDQSLAASARLLATLLESGEAVEAAASFTRPAIDRCLIFIASVRIRGKPVRATFSDKATPCPLDRVNRQFRAPASNRLWVWDFTYVATGVGFVYVAFVIDI